MSEQDTENFDSTNEEELLENNSQEHGSEDETDETSEEQTESFDEQDDSDGGSDEVTIPKEKYEKLTQKLKEKSIQARIKSKKEDSTPQASAEEITLARLEARGILDKDEQREVLRISKNMGKNPIEALEDEYLQFKLDKYRRGKEVAQATPSSSKKGTSMGKNVEWYISRDEMPDYKKNPDLFAKVQDELARRSKMSA